MKLRKTKTLTIISGLLSLNGLAMLFFGLVQQMSQSSNFGPAAETVHAGLTASIAIFVGTLMMIVFGLAFFNGWAKIKVNRIRC